ncbi:MAG: myxococcus cysteine-rich repeat containing protein [Nanoarchaeota archaeon]
MINNGKGKFILKKQSFKFLLLTILFFLLTLFFQQSIQADVVSVNSGGSQEIAVTPDKYVEGFFFGIPVAAAVCGNSIIETGEQCDDGNAVSGDGCSSTCQTEVVTPPGGGGGGGARPYANINVSPIEFNVNLILNTTTERTIRVTNLGTSPVTVGISQSNLDNHVILGNTTLTIPAGQSIDLKVIFVALSEPGIFAGTINIGGRTVLVSLNVKTQFLLFDSNIIVLNKDYQVQQGDELKTKVTLIPLGDPERLDVGLFFTIRDYSGKIYLTKSETILVEELTELERNFDTGSLPLRNYVVSLELRYPNGVAPSSAHFEITKKSDIIGRIILYLITMILITLIMILIIIIWKRREKKEEENVVAT